jgi:hypothetical protein
MNTRKLIVSSLAGLALAAVAVHAQEIQGTPFGTGASGFATGNTDDLVLAFYSSDVGSDLMFDIGNVTSYTSAGPGVYNVAEFTGGSAGGDPTLGSGVSDFNTLFASTDGALGSNTKTRWTVGGGDPNSNELWLVSPVGGAVQKAISDQSQVSGNINTTGGAGEGNSNTSGANPGDAIVAHASGEAMYNDINQTTHAWIGGYGGATADSSVSGTTELELYDLVQTSGGTAAGSPIGFFTLNSATGGLTFTVIPEPSTYAAILGALTVGFVLFRRRFGAASFNVLA